MLNRGDADSFSSTHKSDTIFIYTENHRGHTIPVWDSNTAEPWQTVDSVTTKPLVCMVRYFHIHNY